MSRRKPSLGLGWGKAGWWSSKELNWALSSSFGIKEGDNETKELVLSPRTPFRLNHSFLANRKAGNSVLPEMGECNESPCVFLACLVIMSPFEMKASVHQSGETGERTCSTKGNVMLRADWLSHILTERYWRWPGQTHLHPAARVLPLPAPQCYLASSSVHLSWSSPHASLPKWFHPPNYIQLE